MDVDVGFGIAGQGRGALDLSHGGLDDVVHGGIVGAVYCLGQGDVTVQWLGVDRQGVVVPGLNQGGWVVVLHV